MHFFLIQKFYTTFLNKRSVFLFTAAIVILKATFCFGQNSVEHRLVVQSGSTVTINGSTNVNKFQCSTSKYSGTDTLVLVSEKTGHNPVFKKGLVSISAADFNCGMKLITEDFLKNIQAEQYPELAINFISFHRMPKYKPGEEFIKCKMKISIAGTNKMFDIKCRLNTDKEGYIKLNGQQDFKFSDFKLIAPKRMMGMVKVNETLQVIFDLVLKKE